MSGTYCYVSNQIRSSNNIYVRFSNRNPSVFGEDSQIDNFMERVSDVGQGLLFSFERVRPMPPSEQQQWEETFGEVDADRFLGF